MCKKRTIMLSNCNVAGVQYMCTTLKCTKKKKRWRGEDQRQTYCYSWEKVL